MAESYRGLTIRIGGDTTKLTKALKAADGAAAGAQQELRKLSSALKMDPGNIEAYNLQLGYMSDKATATAMRLYQLKQASEEIGKNGIKLQSGEMSEEVAKLAAETENVHMRATQAKAAYNKVNDSLADMYQTLSKYNEKAAEAFNTEVKLDLGGSIDINSVDEALDDFAASLQQKMDQYAGTVEPLKRPISEVIEEMKKLRDQYVETDSEAKKSKLQERFESLYKEITELNGLKINYAEGSTDWSQLDATLETLKSLEDLGLDPTRISYFRAEVSRLKEEYEAAMDELQKANAVAQFSDLQVEIVKALASVKSLAKALTEVKGPSEALRAMNDLTEAANQFKAAYRSSMSSGKTSESAFSINPDNVEASDAAMRSFAEAEMTAADRADVIREKISKLDATKIYEYADAGKSVEKQLLDAAVAHDEAAQKVSEFKGAVEATRLNLSQLGLDANEVAKILESAEFDVGGKLDVAQLFEQGKKDEAIKWINDLVDALDTLREQAAASGDVEQANKLQKQRSQAEQLASAYENLSKAEAEEARTAEKVEYSKQRRDLEALENELVEAVGDMDKARVAQQQLAAGEIKPHVDTSELDRLKDLRAEFERFGSSVSQTFGDTANDIGVIGPIVDDAVKRSQQLFAAFEANPSNVAALGLSVQAADEAIEGASIHARQLREILEGYSPDDIDEVALATNTVGINAERAAHKVEETFRAIEKARSDADDAARRYADALKSASGNTGGADNDNVAELKKQLDAAEQKFHDLEAAGAEALRALDIATATREYAGYREELARVEQKQLAVAEAATKTMTEMAKAFASDSNANFLENVFGGIDERIEELGTAFDVAAERARVFENATERIPGNLDLAQAAARSTADAVSVGVKEAVALSNAIESIKASGFTVDGLDTLREQFGSANAAARETERTVASLTIRVADAEAALNAMDEGDQGYEDAWYAVEELKDRLEAVRKASAEAAVYDQWEQYEQAIAGVNSQLSELVAKSFEGDMFADVRKSVRQLDDTIESARAKVRAIDDQMSAEGKSDSLLAERARQVEVAVSAAQRRTEMLVETFGSVGESERLDDMIGKFSSIGAAVESLSADWVDVAKRIADAHKQIDDFADTSGLGREWAANFKDLGAEITDIPPELDGVRDTLEQLSGVLSRIGSDLQFAAMAQQAEQFSGKMHQTAEVVRRDFDKPVKVKVELDDSLSGDLQEVAGQLKEFGFSDTGIDDLLTGLHDMGASVSHNREQFESLKKAIKDAPDDQELLNKAMAAGRTYAESLRRHIEDGEKALSKWDKKSIDETSISAGKVGENLKRAQREFDAVQEEVEELEKELKEARQALEDLNGVDTDHAQAEVDSLNEKLAETKKRADEAKERLTTAQNTKMYADIEAEVSIDRANLAAVESDIENELKPEAKVDQAAFQQALGQLTQYAERAGRAVVESANTIDSAYREMRKTVQGTEDEFEALMSEAVKFSQTNAVPAETILQMDALGGQMGIVVGELQQFGELASNLTIATDIDASDVALQLGQISNIMSDIGDVSSMERFGDALVRLGNNAAAQESAIMNVAQRIAAVGNVTSMSSAQVLGWAAAVAETGQRSESAATAIVNTIEGIGNAVNAGGETLEQFAMIAGMTSEEFSDAWANSSSDALQAFVEGLGTLTDDSTAAIAALDSVGISSVRQETALLALSQTVDNLDDNVLMATNAFNGVSDQWGQAGDAAREAQNKSEGFSGQLQIMQNNAADLAASLGDSLVPIMQVISEALKTVTNLLGAIPAPIQSLIVGTISLTAVGGTAAEFIDRITNGFSALAGGAGNATGVLARMTSVATSLAPAFMEAHAGVAALSGALMTGLAGAAIVAAIAAIGAVVDGLQKLHERQEQARLATEGLTTAINAESEAFQKQAEGAKTAREAIQELKDETESLTKSQADFASRMQDAWDKLGTDASKLRNYTSEIKNMASTFDGSQASVSMLKDAVAQFNEMTGASLEIVDEQTGQLSLSAEQIDEVAAAWQRQQEIDLASDQKAEALEKQAEAERILAEHTDDATEAIDRNSVAGGLQAGAANDATAAAVNAGQSIGEVKANYEAATTAIEQANSVISKGEMPLSSLSTALVAAGVSAQQYGRLTAEEQRDVEAAFASSSRTISALAQILSKYGISVKGFSADAAATMKNLQAMTKSAGPSDVDVTDYSRELDAAYDKAKADADAFQKSEQKRLDKEVKATQKAMDAAYKARQKELDAEYKAAQKASQKYLKSYKEAQAEEVEAFKAATDERVKELEREHDYKKQLLEEEYEMYDSRYDEQIAAIEAEQDAEDLAKEQRERSEKLTDLQHAVDTAKSAKKREEAEKALADYKEELAAKDRKTSRQNQIQAIKDAKSSLKEQLTDREAHLKDTYSLAVEQYKAERAAIQKEMTKANEIEYEKVQEAEQAKLEAMKEGHSAELESMKEAQSAELDAMKEANSEYLDGIKATNDAALKALKQANDDALKYFKETGVKLTSSIQEIMDALLKSGAITSQTYEDVMAGVPGSIEKMFGELGLTVDNGLGDVAKKMYESGLITKQQYTDVMNGVPGSLEAICNDAGVIIAQELGLLEPIMANAAKKGTEGFEGELDNLKAKVRQKAGEINSEAANIMSDTTLGGPLERTNAMVAMVTKKYAELATSIKSETTNADSALATAFDAPATTPPTERMGMFVSAMLQKYSEMSGGAKSTVTDMNASLQDVAGADTQGVANANMEAYVGSTNAAVSSMGEGANASVAAFNAELAGIANQGTIDAAGANMGVFHATVTTGAENAKAAAEGGARGSNEALSMIGAGGVAKDVADNLLGVVNAGKGVLDGGKQAYETGGGNLIASIANGASGRTDDIANAVKASVGSAAAKADGESREGAATVGRNFDVGIANGINENTSFIATAAANAAAAALSAANARLKIHSPSREAAKIGRFFDLGIAQGVRLNAGEVEDAASGIGDAMTGAFDPLSLRVNTDFMQSLIDDMRARENDLRAQAERMTRIVEDGFDPHVTLDAAFDAIGRIEAGRLRREQAVASKQTVDNSTYAPSITINIPGVVVREEADIELLSQRIATNVRRELSSRIG